MAYIGKQPVVGNFLKLDSITTSATTTFNLTSGGVAYYPQTATNCIVSLNGVIQSPISAYTISGSTIVFSDALTTSDVIDFIVVLGDVLSIGTPSNGTITSAKLASGTGGLVDWQSVKTSGFTAVAGKGYFCNTTSAAFTVTLPASPSAGDEIILVDYAGTFDTNALTISPNGNKIEGGTSNLRLIGDRESVRIVYVDSTQGWIGVSGFQEGTDGLSPAPYSIDFLVIAGGGGGGSVGGGGGAGGYRTSTQTVNGGTVITVTVGDGGTGSVGTSNSQGTQGSSSSISGSGLTTITSAGGGGGASDSPPQAGTTGGSGGGGCQSQNANRAGNTPSTSPSQGNDGGTGSITAPSYGSGGGGGAGASGSNGSSSVGGNGGNGTASSITGSSVTRAGGGGGGKLSSGTIGTGGTGGGGNGGSTEVTATSGTANLGGGGGGGGYVSSTRSSSGTGGKGVVILSVPTASYSGTTTGSPTVTTSGSNTIIQFNGSGSYTA